MDDVAQAILVKETLDGKIVFGSIFLSITYSKIKEQFHGINKNVKSEQNLPSSTNILLNKKFPVHSMPELLPIPQKQIFPNPFDKAFPLISTSILEETKSLSSEHQSQTVSSLFSSLSDINEEKSNKILMVKNLPKNVTARMLFRLFGMYGNVQKIKIFYKNRENALVEYQDQFQANLAKVSLNNCPLFGNNIFVTNAKQGAFIDTGSLKKEEENQYMGDYTASTEHRYKFAGSKNYFNIAPPSKVIHISNLCADKEENFYRELFKHCGKIKKFMFLKGGSKMALIEFENIGDAVSILVQFHNYNINGKFLKISFSKYSKIKESQ